MPRRIYLTYEELKPYLEFNHLFNPLWIYLTYEELKPAFSSPWSTESFRIYLTYEELKLGGQNLHALVNQGFILPMRN